MDDVADLIQDSAETLKLYDVRKVNDEIARLTDLSVKCCERVKDAVALIGRLADAATAEAALKTCEEIDRLESDAHRTHHHRRHHRGRLDPARQRGALGRRWQHRLGLGVHDSRERPGRCCRLLGQPGNFLSLRHWSGHWESLRPSSIWYSK